MRTVLIADDEPTIRKLVAAVLDRTDIRTLEAADGAQALEMVRRHQPDLILLDILMPKINGIDVCQQVRAERAIARTPVVMLTACGQESDRERGRRAGADGFIVKPFSPAALLETVVNTLAGGARAAPSATR